MTLYTDISIRAEVYKMTEQNKNNTKESIDDQRDGSIKPTETWINKTRSKNGFIIVIKNDFKKGDILLGGIAALKEFIDDDRNGINLGIMTFKKD